MKAVKFHFMKKSNTKHVNINLLFRSSYISEITETDIEQALTPIHTIVLAVKTFYFLYFLEKIW